MLSDILSDKQLATMANRLQVPLIVQDILSDEGALTEDVQMGLHQILSDDQPDSALLSIALSAKIIANTCAKQSPSLCVLNMECDRILIEYGPLWLKNAESKSVDDTLVFETLAHIPEDLETLAELLEFHAATLNNQDAVTLCEIMSIQAGAQGLIAETFLESFETKDPAPWTNLYANEDIDMGTLVMAEQAAQPFYTDNIIPFPETQN